jgi:hypothetical protein
VRSIARTSSGSSTTQIRVDSRRASPQMKQGSFPVSVMLQQTLQ